MIISYPLRLEYIIHWYSIFWGFGYGTSLKSQITCTLLVPLQTSSTKFNHWFSSCKQMTNPVIGSSRTPFLELKATFQIVLLSYLCFCYNTWHPGKRWPTSGYPFWSCQFFSEVTPPVNPTRYKGGLSIQVVTNTLIYLHCVMQSYYQEWLLEVYNSIYCRKKNNYISWTHYGPTTKILSAIYHDPSILH